MSSKRLVGVAAALLSLAPAAANAQQTPGNAAGRGGNTSGSFEQACVDLVQGRPPAGGPSATDALRKACSDLMSSRADAQRKAEEQAQVKQFQAQQQAQAAPPGAAAAGTGAGQGAAGAGQAGGSQAAQGLGGAFEQAGRELVGQGGRPPIGLKRSGQPFGFTLVTDPVGWFTGLGINAELFGAVPGFPKFSWLGGARYSRTDATNGSVNTFGAEVGADYFIIGRDNEGLRIGPRLEAAFGRESFQTATTFGWLGLSGEVGYNFIATNGITGSLSAGLGGRVAGHKRENFASFTGGEFGPYGRVGLGYSW